MSAKECLKRIRLDMSFTQREFAKLLQMSPSVYSLYETGARKPGLITIRNIVSNLKKHDIVISYRELQE